ncbi:MAG: hypothetical protein Q7K16_04550 [Candidatus Azambacteria bacterium]|nr:hypothetical protein [Candidatus Azambacteria bacterium]
MIRPGKILIAGAVIAAVFVSLFYLLSQRENEYIDKTANILGQPEISWQKITITEKKKNVLMNITAPRIIIDGDYGLNSEINKAITQWIEYSKSDFISAVTTARPDNGETNTFNINTEVLLITPRLISLAFTVNEYLGDIQEKDPEQTFIVFDVEKDRVMESVELFRNMLAWSKAVRIIKASLLSGYKGDPNCDLFFAPKHNGFAASCIGIDWSRGGEHLSITGDVPMSIIQEFLAPSVLSDIIQ